MKREYYRLLAIIVASLGIHIRDDYHRIYSRPRVGKGGNMLHCGYYSNKQRSFPDRTMHH